MKIVKESINEIKRANPSDTLKSMGVGTRAMIEKWCDDNNIRDYHIDSNNEINCENVDLHPDVNSLPDTIKFNKVKNFSAQGLNIPKKDLSRFLPRHVSGILMLASWMSPTPKYTIKDIISSCNLAPTAKVYLRPNVDSYARYKYRRKPGVENRPDHIIPNDDPANTKITYSNGFKTYSILKYILEAGQYGRSYKDIITYAYKMSNPGKDLPNTGYWSGAFREIRNTSWSREYEGPMIKYTDKMKNPAGKDAYFVNRRGMEFLDTMRGTFERK